MPAPKPKKAPAVKKTASAAKAVSLMPKRVEVVYKGRVQGVGFRYTAEKIALECGVKGWVRNETNGDVKLVAEGVEKELNRLLAGVRLSVVGRHITKEKIAWSTYLNEFDDFKIEYHL